jgi:cell division protein FtsL
MFQENKISTQNDIQKLQSQLQEKRKTTNEITSELQVGKSQRFC